MSYGDEPVLWRLDPPGCGCLECLTGESKPWPEATQAELRMCMEVGEKANATNGRIVEDDDGTCSVVFGPVPERLDSQDCVCDYCQIGYNKPWNLGYNKPWNQASQKELRACFEGELENCTGGQLAEGSFTQEVRVVFDEEDLSTSGMGFW